MLNKTDLPLHPGIPAVFPKGGTTVTVEVSAKTGAGLDELRRELLSAVGLTDWRQNLPALVTERQRNGCRAALSALESGPAPGNVVC